ncbi:MAG: ABC transporter substrate-binding protein [Candidatus Aureabacteria bacterium]|nr:ABC transporter substrate-binding protein [Candidatus Auribacterota bacterium]
MKSFAFGMMMSMVFAVSACAQESAPPPVPAVAGEELRLINDFASPPFAWMEGTKRMGFEVDLAEALGKEMGRTVRWVPMSFNIVAFASALQAKTADAVMSSMSATPEREKKFIFTRPYFRSSLALATGKDVDFSEADFRGGLEGMKVGVLKRTTGEDWAKANLRATRVTYDSPVRLARALNNKEIGYILLDEDILIGVLARQAYKFKIVKGNLSSEDYAIAVSLGNQVLADGISAALEKLDAAGIYDDIFNAWFGRKTDLPPYKRLFRR